jgi:hypothetical protein
MDTFLLSPRLIAGRRRTSAMNAMAIVITAITWLRSEYTPGTAVTVFIPMSPLPTRCAFQRPRGTPP